MVIFIQKTKLLKHASTSNFWLRKPTIRMKMCLCGISFNDMVLCLIIAFQSVT